MKAWRPALPMGALLVATQLPDLIFAPLALAGLETWNPPSPV